MVPRCYPLWPPSLTRSSATVSRQLFLNSNDTNHLAAKPRLVRREKSLLLQADVFKKSPVALAKRLHIDFLESAARASEQLTLMSAFEKAPDCLCPGVERLMASLFG
jgi:hypothetical protein